MENSVFDGVTLDLYKNKDMFKFYFLQRFFVDH